MKKILLTLMTGLISASGVWAQNDLLLYPTESIPMNTYLQPATLPVARGFAAIPFFPAADLEYSNSAFSFKDLFQRRSDDSLSVEIGKVEGQMHTNNFLAVNFGFRPVAFGFYAGKNYLTFDVTERMNFNFSYSKDLIDLIYYGNGALIGKTADFSKTAFDLSHFRQYGIGFARAINEKLHAGIRLKYLYGMDNFCSSNGKFSLYTAQEDYSLTVTSGITINSSSTQNTDEDVSAGRYLTGLQNTGFAADLGATYKLTDKWDLGMSILDLGAIRWRSYTKNYTVKEGSYTFSGVDLHSFLNDSTDGMGKVLDSLGNSFKSEETAAAYTEALPAHVYLNGRYRISEKSSAGALMHLLFFKGTVQPAVSFSYGRKAGKHFEFNFGWSYINHTFTNIGTAMAVNLGAFQFFIATDDLTGLILPLKARTLSVHTGMNLRFGRSGKKEAAKPEPSKP